ncbi:hypothetical protein SAY87_026971 [Trapa incisa]|uniref:Target of Myb protein 1 n=1 Tax=Trapa incisa TaxID=236973 RepID=A0AAN7GYJ1_9MYRT|nr:hypothetical protein SAY87_026971 [Trapa incisa]
MLSASSSSVTVRVEKATSDLLINPDWTMNIDICDYVNTHPGQARDVLKALKKRLQHKSPRVQFLALTLLEAMVNNCGDYIHFQIVEKNILEEMVKIVKKKTDMNVRDKTLSLLDAWHEAFGGQGGKYPQYYYAYDELRRSGIAFPRRASPAVPIFTPPIGYPVMGHVRDGYGNPSNSLRRLDEAMAAESDILSGPRLESMQNTMELLSDMLQAMSPGDKEALKDEVVIDLVDRCRSNQKRLTTMLTASENEKLLARGLELHEVMENVLAKHDDIASGLVLPSHSTDNASTFAFSTQTSISSPRATENCSEPKKDISPEACASPQSPATTVTSSKDLIDAEEEEDDDFAQLARRHSRPPGTAGQIHTSATQAPDSDTSKALVSTDPVPVMITKDRDMMDLLSLSFATTSDCEIPRFTASLSHQASDNIPVSSNGNTNPYSSELNINNPEQAYFRSYVASWSHPQVQLQTQPQQQMNTQSQYHENPHGYPPPPWESSSNTFSDQHHLQMSGSSSGFAAGAGPVAGNSVAANNRASFTTVPANAPSSIAQKPYVPTYLLFEDLNVLPNGDGLKDGNGMSNLSSSSRSNQHSRNGGGM